MKKNGTLYSQPTIAPTRKMTGAILGGSVATLTMAGISVFFPDHYAKLSSVAGVETAIGSIVSIAVGYFTKERV